MINRRSILKLLASLPVLRFIFKPGEIQIPENTVLNPEWTHDWQQGTHGHGRIIFNKLKNILGNPEEVMLPVIRFDEQNSIVEYFDYRIKSITPDRINVKYIMDEETKSLVTVKAKINNLQFPEDKPVFVENHNPEGKRIVCVGYLYKSDLEESEGYKVPADRSWDFVEMFYRPFLLSQENKKEGVQ